MNQKQKIHIFTKSYRLIFRIIKSFFFFIYYGTKSLIIHLKLSAKGVKFQKSVRGNRFYINNAGSIFLDDKVYLHSFPNGSMHRTALSTYLSEAVIKIGENSKLNGTIIHCNNRVEIGKNCMFGPGSIIVDNDSHRVTKFYNERIKQPENSPVIIHNNVWVGMNSIILKGVIIGENSIVAAGSIVTKNIESNCLYAGSPAKLIKKLV